MMCDISTDEVDRRNVDRRPKVYGGCLVAEWRCEPNFTMQLGIILMNGVVD